MKKIYLLLNIFFALNSFSINCKLLNELAFNKANKVNKKFTLDKLTAYKVEKIDEMLSDVLKTSEQLVPKQCWYIDIKGIKKEEFPLAKKAIKVSVLANSTINPNLNVFIQKDQEAFNDIVSLVKEYGIKNVYTYSNEKDLIKDILKIKGSNSSLFHRRILLLTSSKNMRVEYSKLIDALEDNKEDMVIDNFAYLYNDTQEKYEFSTKQDILNSYNQIHCK